MLYCYLWLYIGQGVMYIIDVGVQCVVFIDWEVQCNVCIIVFVGIVRQICIVCIKVIIEDMIVEVYIVYGEVWVGY